VVEFVKSIKNEILRFTGGYEQNDDITLVAIKENMAAVDVKLNIFRELFEGRGARNGETIAEACRKVGISPSTYYRYKRLYEEGGYEYLREMLHGYTNVGQKHLSIEVKTKIYDIIREHPEYGPKKISDLLNTEKYGFTKVSPKLIYEELKRAKLNTKAQRVAFVKRGGKQRLKPPGTPLLTLDGEVLVGFRSEELSDNLLNFVPNVSSAHKSKEKILHVKGKRLPAIGETDDNPEPNIADTGETEKPIEEEHAAENPGSAEENDKNVNDFVDSGDDKIVEKEINGNKDEKKH